MTLICHFEAVDFVSVTHGKIVPIWWPSGERGFNTQLAENDHKTYH